MGCSKSSFKREVYTNTILPQEIKPSSRQPNFHLKQLEKEEQKYPKINRRKEILKIRAETNENERNNSKD